MAGIYIHIPFCKQACHYCDFHFSTNLKRRGEMIDALCKELELRRHYLGKVSLHSIYFGGGTPSLLSDEEILQLMTCLHRHYTIVPEAEVTLEANPDDLTDIKLAMLASAGFNRLSIGIQTFQNELLRKMNRAHSAGEAKNCIAKARDAGFDNLNLDLIYAIPGQTDQMLEADMEAFLAFRPEHISAYTLTIEPKTAFGRWNQTGKLLPVSDNNTASMMNYVMRTLVNNGYQHYEISNFCLPGKPSAHNSSYWAQQPYLGIGPGAHSYNGHTRQYNVTNNPQYIKSITAGTIPCTREMLSRKDKINEYILTSLRTQQGCDMGLLKDTFGYELPEIGVLEQRGWVFSKNNVVYLSDEGKLMADYISSQLFI